MSINKKRRWFIVLNRWKVYKDNFIVFSIVIGMFTIPIFLCLMEFFK
ncbi:hypothetical protein LMOSLCC2376_1504 [Listeria monocytogenes SLCC2376]|nr:hypothetical protein LMOSLCC2376_1504 [Listeria monocytogenes SLCC2376]